MQAFVDDIAAVQYEATFIKRMFESNENVMNLAGLEVKLSKCAVPYVCTNNFDCCKPGECLPSREQGPPCN